MFLTAPDGERLGFTFAPQKSEGPGFAYWTPAWVADADNGWQLRSLALKLQRGADRFYDLATGMPYNPAAFGAESAQYELIAPDGTVYEIAAASGITGIVFSDGVRLAVSDSGITGPDDEYQRWMRDGSGALHHGHDAGRAQLPLRLRHRRQPRVGTQPRGREFATLRLRGTRVAPLDARDGSEWRCGDRLRRYGQRGSGEGRNLGAALGYLAAPRSATLAAGEEHLYSLATRDSEVVLPASSAVLLGVIVTAADAGALDPALPALLGHQAIASRVEDGRAFALYRVDRAALDLLRIGGSGSGSYTLEFFVAGDVNRDAKVDAADAALLADLRRTGGYDPGADFDGDGALTVSDTQLLFASLGYSANAGPGSRRRRARPTSTSISTGIWAT